MPKFPDDMEKARAFDTKRRAEGTLPQQLVKGVPLPDEDAELEALRNEAAEKLGVDPSEVTMIACKRGRR